MSIIDKIVTGKTSLRPRARIMRTLGDELISSDIVAIIELVKNAYDADASIVLIRISDSDDEFSCIEIIDNGHGMSPFTVQNIWMEPATVFKKYATLSEFGNRRVLGNKGIGRFAASRLADELELITKRSEEEKETVVNFDWKQFDDDDKYLDEIQVDWTEREPYEIKKGGTIEALWNNNNLKEEQIHSENDFNHGTILRMAGLRNTWTNEQLTTLRTNLARMVLTGNNLSKTENRKFTIRLKGPYNESSNEDDRISASYLLKNPPYKLYGMVTEEGNYSLQISVRGQKEDIFIENRFPDRPSCGPFGIILEVWDRDKDSLSHLISDGSTLKNIRDALDKAAGISIYRDGFRVLPYGEPNNDWLRLDIRSRLNPTKHVANNQVIGFIAITADQNSNLKDQSNREGLMEGSGLDSLKNLIKEIIANIESVRYKARRPKNSKEDSKKQNGHNEGFFNDFDFEHIYDSVKSKHPEDAELIKAIQDKEKTLKLKMKKFQEVLSRYRRHSTLGQLVDTVLHEGRAPIAKIKNEAILGKRDVTKINNTLNINIERYKAIESQADVLSSVFNRLEPFSGRKRQEPSNYIVENVIKQVIDVLGLTIRETKTKINFPLTTTTMFMEKTEIQEIILNLLDNSLHWLKGKQEDEREITIIVERSQDDSIQITFSDSGPGIREEDKDYIFEPYYTNKIDGVGLGLTIAGEIASDYYSGKLELVDSGPLSGATFRITLFRRE